MHTDSIGQKIKKLRKKMGLSQVELAVEINRTRSFVSNIENEIDTPGLYACIAFAKFFNVTLDWLVFNEKDIINIVDNNEKNLIYAYRKMSKDKADMFLKLMVDAAKNDN